MIEYHHFVYFTILNELIECIFEWVHFYKKKIRSKSIFFRLNDQYVFLNQLTFMVLSPRQYLLKKWVSNN